MNQGQHHIPSERTIEAAKAGNNQAFEDLAESYSAYIGHLCAAYSSRFVEESDVRQVALIGLMVGLRTVDASRGSRNVFLKMCMDRMVITHTKSAYRNGNKILNKAITMDGQNIGWTFDGSNEAANLYRHRNCYVNNNCKSMANPLDLLLKKETRERMENALRDECTQLEYAVLTEWRSGANYTEICDKIGIDKRQIDNAFQRAHKKAVSMAMQRSNWSWLDSPLADTPLKRASNIQIKSFISGGQSISDAVQT